MGLVRVKRIRNSLFFLPPYLVNYPYMKTVDDNTVVEVHVEQPKKTSKSSSKQKFVALEDLDPDAPRSVFQDRNWNKELKQH